MPRHTAVTHFQHPDLGAALRWLREQRAGLTRGGVTDRAAGAVSEPYLRKLENGERQALARAKLDVLLALYGSSVPEFEGLLAARPWDGGAADRAWKPSVATPDPGAYRMAASGALADLTDAGTWSAPVEDPVAAVRIRGQATELVEHFVRLSAPERAEVLNAVRARRYGSNNPHHS